MKQTKNGSKNKREQIKEKRKQKQDKSDFFYNL